VRRQSYEYQTDVMDATTTTTSDAVESTQSAAADLGFWKEVRHIIWDKSPLPYWGPGTKPCTSSISKRSSDLEMCIFVK